jgi:hypothetical protein
MRADALKSVRGSSVSARKTFFLEILLLRREFVNRKSSKTQAPFETGPQSSP